MKDIRQALHAFLSADAAITTVVGSPSRIFPIQLPQGEERSSLVYTRISERGEYILIGGSAGVAETRIQIDAWAQSVDEASELANVVKDRMDDFVLI